MMLLEASPRGGSSFIIILDCSEYLEKDLVGMLNVFLNELHFAS